MAEPKSFVGRCVEFFGKKPGQDLRGFSAELKALTNQDKADLMLYFAEVDLPIKVESNR
jgi:hypothetical protein